MNIEKQENGKTVQHYNLFNVSSIDEMIRIILNQDNMRRWETVTVYGNKNGVRLSFSDRDTVYYISH